MPSASDTAAPNLSIAQQRARALWISPQSFHSFAELILRETGIKMPSSKLTMLQSRLQHRMRHHGLSSLEQYRSFLFGPPVRAEELTDFIDAITTNKTDFFREPDHFDFLARSVRETDTGGQARARKFKAWCAGCSSGEEAYTLAMVLAEFANERGDFHFDVFATDISTRVLRKARKAVYEEPRVEPVPQALRKRWLLRSKDRSRGLVRISPALRGQVRFARLNFMQTNYHLREVFDVIFFRNVMIYFDKETQAQVVERLCRHLRPGGYLFIGHSESLVGFDQLPLRMVGPAIYRK